MSVAQRPSGRNWLRARARAHTGWGRRAAVQALARRERWDEARGQGSCGGGEGRRSGRRTQREWDEAPDDGGDPGGHGQVSQGRDDGGRRQQGATGVVAAAGWR